MKKTKNNESKKVTLLKASLLVVVSVIMLFLTPLIFQVVGDTLASNCPSYTEYGACEMGHGLRAGAGAAGASEIWVLTALYLLVGSIIKFVRLNR